MAVSPSQEVRVSISVQGGSFMRVPVEVSSNICERTRAEDKVSVTILGLLGYGSGQQSSKYNPED